MTYKKLVRKQTEKIVKLASNDLMERVFESLDGLSFESPIEEMFATAYLARSFVNLENYHLNFSGDIERLESLNPNNFYNLISQKKIENYRVDFVLEVYFYVDLQPNNSSQTIKSLSIAIECDGREFHHGNEKNAARDKVRDRVLSEHFSSILRFTGSELYKNSYACVEQAIEVANTKSSDFVKIALGRSTL